MLNYEEEVSEIRAQIKVSDSNHEFEESNRLFKIWEELNAKQFPQPQKEEEVVEEPSLSLNDVFERFYSVVSPLKY